MLAPINVLGPPVFPTVEDTVVLSPSSGLTAQTVPGVPVGGCFCAPLVSSPQARLGAPKVRSREPGVPLLEGKRPRPRV